jgi:very-short-patch-repair endonuclease
MWDLLKPFRDDGIHFRRQVQLGGYFADIASHGAKIVIEIDGATHTAEPAALADKVRDDYFRSRGFRVFWFWNNEVMGNPEGVLESLRTALGTPTPNPSPQGGGEWHDIRAARSSPRLRRVADREAITPSERLPARKGEKTP